MQQSLEAPARENEDCNLILERPEEGDKFLSLCTGCGEDESVCRVKLIVRGG